MRRLAIVALCAAAPAWAGDSPDDDHRHEPTAVRVSLAGTQVRMVARFAFEVEGPAALISTQTVPIPATSVVTTGTVIVDGKRHRLRLENANTAQRAFDALTVKPGTEANRAWAFMLEGGNHAVSLDVLAPKRAKVVLELGLEAPTCFFRDRRYVELPIEWWQRLGRARERDEEAIAEACGSSFDDRGMRWVSFASGHLARQPAGTARIGAIAWRLPLDSLHVARVEIDIASKLSEVPEDLHTVIVVDHSHSMTSDELEAQRMTVAAYLRGAPTSRVQLIGYARASRPLLAGWMVASHAASRIDAELRGLAPRNGSNLDLALDEAARWLARVNGTKRILLFSDERLKERLASLVDSLDDRIADDTLVQVVRPTAGAGLVRRESLLWPLARATGGIQVFGSPDPDTAPDATLLVRPTSLDDVDVKAAGWEPTAGIADSCRTVLSEGNSCDFWLEGNGAAGPITITGMLWSKPFKRVIRADPSQARTLARVLSAIATFETDVQQQVDRAAFAVSSMWSLFGQWGGTGGYEDVGGLGTIGIGSIGTRSHDSGTGVFRSGQSVAEIDLEAQLQPVIARCKPGDAQVTVAVELTLQEIVAVSATVVPENPPLRECIFEAIWDTTLRIPSPPPHATARVAIGNKP